MSTNYLHMETAAEWFSRKISQLETALAQSEAGNAKLREEMEQLRSINASRDGGPLINEGRRDMMSSVIDRALATTAGAETLAELQSLRDRLAKAEGERDASRGYVEALNRLESLVIELAPQKCRQNSLGAEDILKRFAADHRELAKQNHLLRHGHIKP